MGQGKELKRGGGRGSLVSAAKCCRLERRPRKVIPAIPLEKGIFPYKNLSLWIRQQELPLDI